MSSAIAPTRTLILRQSKFLLRQPQFRSASSATESAAQTATKAKDAASAQVSKASEGLSRVTSSAGSAISGAAASASTALGRVGGRTGRVIKFVESLIPPTIYYARVGLELGKLVAQHQKMTPPSIATFQSYFQPLTNALRNPKSIMNAVPAPTPEAVQSLRSPSSEQITTVAVIFAQALGFFTVGEMIGRMKLVGYHGEPAHEH